MAKITRLQIDDINNKCGNGFELDVPHYISTGEIRFIKYFNVNKHIKFKCCLFYSKKYRVDKRKRDIVKLIPTNRYIAIIEISKFMLSESLEVWVDQGIELKITSNKFTTDTKSIKYLQNLTHELDDEKLISFINND